MTEQELQQELATQLTVFTRASYLLASAVSIVQSAKVTDLRDHLQDRVQALCREPEKVKDDSIEMTGEQIIDVRPHLAPFLADSLIIRLDAFLHGFLEPGPTKNDRPLEETLSRLWPRESRGSETWAFSRVILLAELRNAIVHGDGVLRVDDKNGRLQRLLHAGVDLDELELHPARKERCFDDVLRFKSGVRTVANACIPRLATR